MRFTFEAVVIAFALGQVTTLIIFRVAQMIERLTDEADGEKLDYRRG